VIGDSGQFVEGGERRASKPGGAISVGAGAEHAFFSDDFAAWMIFCAPEGGEKGPTALAMPREAFLDGLSHPRAPCRRSPPTAPPAMQRAWR
jgi:hypothetical protein